MTELWQIDPLEAEPAHPVIQAAAALLRAGKQVAFPTETVYGLGADAGNTEAVEGIFRAKGRPSDNPLIVHIADRSQLEGLVDRLDETSLRLMDAFWPGPLTLVLPVRPGAVSVRVTAGLATVAVRMPDHPVALALIAAAGCPVAAPSANRSGRPSPTQAAHVVGDLDGLIAGVVDGGPTGVGIESTVVELAQGGGVHVLRPGGVSAEALRRALPGVAVTAAAEWLAGADPAAAAAAAAAAASPGERASAAAPAGADAPELHAPHSPGMKYAHYAPRGRLTVVRAAQPARLMSWIDQDISRAQAAGERTGVLARSGHAAHYRADVVVSLGADGDVAAVARGLYDALRRFDEAGATYILAEAIGEDGLGAAVMNRLRKAAAGRVVDLDADPSPRPQSGKV